MTPARRVTHVESVMYFRTDLLIVYIGRNLLANRMMPFHSFKLCLYSLELLANYQSFISFLLKTSYDVGDIMRLIETININCDYW